MPLLGKAPCLRKHHARESPMLEKVPYCRKHPAGENTMLENAALDNALQEECIGDEYCTYLKGQCHEIF